MLANSDMRKQTNNKNDPILFQKKHVIPLGQLRVMFCTLYCFMPTENGVMLVIWVSSEYLLLSHFISPIAIEGMPSSTGSSVMSSDINSFGIFTLFLWFLWLKWIMKMKSWTFSRKLIGKDDSSFLLLISMLLRMVKNKSLLHDTTTTGISLEGRIKLSFTTAKIIVFKMQEVEIHSRV